MTAPQPERLPDGRYRLPDGRIVESYEAARWVYEQGRGAKE